MMNTKNGNTKSVGVHPNHIPDSDACPSGAYVPPGPGLFTSNIPAIVNPRNKSNDANRPPFGFVGPIPSIPNGGCIDMEDIPPLYHHPLPLQRNLILNQLAILYSFA
jgi:hypothetical protein